MPSVTPNRPSPSCPHERGHGTSVCLRCRADEHADSTARLQRVLAKGAIALVVVGLLLATGGGALAARRGAPGERATPSMTAAVESRSTPPAPREMPKRAAIAPVVAQAGTPTESPTVIASQGRTELADSMYVMRVGDSVTVVFDTQRSRTRRRDKFETVVRETLPAVLGAVGDSLLAAIPVGGLASGGDLLSELTARGVHLPPHDGLAVTLWPATRPGRDGPLVVSYRVTLSPVR